jgi:hypothetical protein
MRCGSSARGDGPRRPTWRAEQGRARSGTGGGGGLSAPASRQRIEWVLSGACVRVCPARGSVHCPANRSLDRSARPCFGGHRRVLLRVAIGFLADAQAKRRRPSARSSGRGVGARGDRSRASSMGASRPSRARGSQVALPEGGGWLDPWALPWETTAWARARGIPTRRRSRSLPPGDDRARVWPRGRRVSLCRRLVLIRRAKRPSPRSDVQPCLTEPDSRGRERRPPKAGRGRRSHGTHDPTDHPERQSQAVR